MYTKYLFLPVVLSIFVFSIPASAYRADFSDDSIMELKGELTYTVKVRTEEQDPDMLGNQFVTVKGNENFEKGDLVNNKGIAKMETRFDFPYLTLFFQGEAFYDSVYDDDDIYIEGADIDEAKFYAARGYEAREYYLDFYTEKFTLRVGRQIVEWGEIIGNFFAPGVSVVNLMDAARVGAAGYEFRDYKVPGHMAWAYYELTNNWSISAVYAPDFEPRYAMPISGTFTSFMDMGGWGAPDDPSFVDDRPDEFSEMQQYGGSTKMIFPSLGHFDLTFYYLHYLSHQPIVTIQLVPFGGKMEYPELDMYGLSFASAIEFGLEIELDGELAFRPNEPYQLTSPGIPLPDGYERTKTFNWGIGGSKTVSNILSFTPWTVQFDPMFSVYGAYNLEHDKELEPGYYFAAPKNTAYYMVSAQFQTFDMIDNTYLLIMPMVTGCLHKEMDSIHTFGLTVKAKYGDYLGIMLGYDYKIGDPEQAFGTPFTVDRDAFTFAVTLYLI